MRYTVFGVRNDVFIAKKTNILARAILMAKITSTEGFKARIWDNEADKFYKPMSSAV